MKRGLLIISICTFILVSCGQKEKGSLEYLLSLRNGGDIDTIYMDIVARQSTDSFDIIKYKTEWYKREDSPYEQEFKLPTTIDTTGTETVRLVLERTIRFDDKDYKIMKYQYDEENGDDEESLYFYSPEFGIILFHWGTHRNSQRLIHTGDKQKDRIIYFLTDKIENDYEMTKEWN